MSFLLAKNRVLEWIVGTDPEVSGTPRLVWANLPESWGVFVLLAVVAAICFGVFWMYRREINTCPMPLKLVMAGLRLTVLLLLLVMFLKPSIFYQQINEIKPTIAMLRDSSLSFDRGDQYRSRDQVDQLAKSTGLKSDQIESGAVKRSALVNEAFRKNPKLLEQLRNKGAIRVVNFSDGNQPVAVIPAIVRNDTLDQESDDAESEGGDDKQTDAGNVDSQDSEDGKNGGLIRENIPDLEANGLGTDIWQALRESLNDTSRMSAILLVSDGQHNGSEDPTEIAQKAATLGIPIFVVGVGDPSPPKNLSVNEVYVRDRAYPDEPFEIEAILQTTQVGDEGMPSEIDVELVQQRVNPSSGKLGAPTQVKSKQVKVPPNGGRMRVDFDHILNEPGKYIYTVQVDALPDENETEDNAMVSSEIEVVDEKIKVLLISGLPSWDYEHVYKLLQRDQTIALSCWLQSMDETRPQEGNEPISRLPQNDEELSAYNVVIMMDPNPAEFDAEWMDMLKNFCKSKAGGFLYMAGHHFTSEFVTMNKLAGVRELLPVRFGDTEYINTVEALAMASETRAGKMLVVNHNMDHPVMSFRSDAGETQKIWSLMPPVAWSFPTISSKPTARVLIENGDQSNEDGNQPMLVAGRYGMGSVLYMGFQGTWRWRPVGVQAQYFDRFWIQVVRYLVETRSLQGSRRGFVDTEKTEFELGDRILLVGRVLNEKFKPSELPVQTAIIRTDDGRTQKVELKLLPNQKGRYEGTFVAQRIGNFEATIDLGTETADQKLIDPIAFRVVPPSAESGAYWLNEKLLMEIATQSGGKYFRLEQLDKVPENLPTLVTKAEFNSPLKPLWDVNQYLRWTVFFLPFLLLSIEWILRKWNKLL